MYTNLHKNTGQIIKLMHKALAFDHKSGNGPLIKIPPTEEGQSQRIEQPQRIEQTDLRPVTVQLSFEAKETLRNNRRKKTKKRNNKKQQKQFNEDKPNY